MEKVKNEFLNLGKTLAAIVATLTAIWFFTEPFLEDYIQEHFETYDSRKKEEWKERKSNIVSLTTLLSEKMGVDEDEVHIEIGKLYNSGNNTLLKIEENNQKLKVYSDSLKTLKIEILKMKNQIIFLENEIKK